MWEQYDVPKSEGTRIHRVGDTLVCVAVEMAGEGDLLAIMPISGAAKPDARQARGKRQQSIALPPLDAPAWSRHFIGRASEYQLTPGYPSIPVCVKLREPFSLQPGSDLRGWIFSRIEARIVVANIDLASFPLAKPFKTLYGTPEAGVV